MKTVADLSNLTLFSAAAYHSQQITNDQENEQQESLLEGERPLKHMETDSTGILDGKDYTKNEGGKQEKLLH